MTALQNPDISQERPLPAPRMPRCGESVVIADSVGARYRGRTGVVLSRSVRENEVLVRMKGRPDAWFRPTEIRHD